MSEKIRQVTVSVDSKEQTIKDMEASGLTVISVEPIDTKGDNSKVRVTGKDFKAKLGHVDREFID